MQGLLTGLQGERTIQGFRDDRYSASTCSHKIAHATQSYITASTRSSLENASSLFGLHPMPRFVFVLRPRADVACYTRFLPRLWTLRVRTPSFISSPAPLHS